MEPQPVISKPQPSKFPVLILAILLIFSLGLSGFLFYQNTQFQKQIAILSTTVNDAPRNGASPTLSTQPTKNPSNQQVYVNTVANYSIEYPSDVKVDALIADAGKLSATPTSSSIYFYNINDAEAYTNRLIDIQIFDGKPSYTTALSTTPTQINSLPATKYTFKEGLFTLYSLATNNGKFLEIMVNNAPERTAKANQIFTTLKFTSSTTPSLKPADAQTPAAGICAQNSEIIVDIALNIDTPSPRCVKVTATQQLRLTNNTDSPLKVTLGQHSVSLPSQGKALLGNTFGSYLEPGVHYLTMSGGAAGSPEIWLQ